MMVIFEILAYTIRTRKSEQKKKSKINNILYKRILVQNLFWCNFHVN